jgi:predicted phosphodiesterase
MEYLVKALNILLFISCCLLTSCNKEETPETANQRFNQSMKWNEQHPYQEIVVPSDNYSIISVADIHVGSTENLDLFVNKAKIMMPAVVVFAGDLTSTGKAEDLTRFENHLPDRSSLNYLLIAGNHDLYSGGWPEFYKKFGASTFMFTIKTPVASDLFICLETGGFTLGRDQFDWLKNILEVLRPGYRRCIIFTHVNFFRTRHTFSTNPFSEEVTTLLATFFMNNVDMVVTGHDHEHSIETFANTTYIIMDALLDGLSNAGYFKLTVSNGRIGYSFEKL